MNNINEVIKDKIDIVGFIGRTVKLKKSGQNFVGMCPFHKESNASFYVSPQRRSWHCFGCDRGGDIFTYVMEQMNIDFRGALEMLAKETNTPMPKYKQEKDNRGRIYQILEKSQNYYHDQLINHRAEAYKYLVEKRQLLPESIQRFKLGYAPDNWQQTGKYLLSQEFTKQELTDAGLIVTKEKTAGEHNWYDRFRGRITFPIHDQIGRVLGFSSRTLDESTHTAKYINSPETQIFKKSSILYGLYQSLKSAQKLNYFIVVEGQLDVISLHQIGIKNAIAPQGSSFTKEQADILKRYTNRVILFFDRDGAGIKATLRTLTLLIPLGMDIKIARTSQGKDPDESAHNNPEKTHTDIKDAMEYFPFLIQLAQNSVKTDSSFSINKIVSFLLPFVAIVRNSVVQETQLKQLAHHTQISIHNLEKELSKYQTPPDRTTLSPVKKSKPKPLRIDTLWQEMITMLLQLPSYLENDAQVIDILKPLKELSPTTPTSHFGIKVTQHVITNGKINPHELNKNLTSEENAWADKLILKDLGVIIEDEEKYLLSLEQVTDDIMQITIQEKIRELANSEALDKMVQIRDLTYKLKRFHS